VGGAQASVLIGVVAPAMMGVVSMVGHLPLAIPSTSAGVQDNTSVTDGADTLLYRGQVSSPHATWRLVDRRISGIPFG
jgi:hypothetical protein